MGTVASWSRALSIAALALLAPLAPVEPTAARAATTWTNPVISGSFANPFVIKAGSTYYAYANGFDYFLPFHVPAFSSTDLATWTMVGNVLPTPGAWAENSSGLKFTSPSVAYISANPAASRYVLYYTGIERVTQHRCIGTATAPTPAGPFVAAPQPLLCPGGGASDPSPIRLPDGAALQELVYRWDATGDVYNQVLTANGQAIHPSLPTPFLLYQSQPAWWQLDIVQRPAVVPGPAGKVYLFFSGGPAYTPARAIGWSSCTAPFGIVTTCTPQSLLGTWIDDSNGLVDAVSGVQPFSDGTNWWIAYDGVPNGSCIPLGGCTGNRSMRIDKLCFAPDGVPRTSGPTTTAQSLTRFANCSQDVPGRALSVASVDDTRTLSQPPSVTLRDGGASAPIAGRALFTFSDTILTTLPALTNTASLGVAANGLLFPNMTTEPLGANGRPSQFIPFTADEELYNVLHNCPSPCDGNRMALWTLGVLPAADGGALAFFLKLIVKPGQLNYEFLGHGVVHVPPNSTTANRDDDVSPVACNPVCLFDASDIGSDLYNAPLVKDGYVYLFGSGKIARAPLAAVETPSAWQFYTGTGAGWSTTESDAIAVPNLMSVGSISYNAYLDAYLVTSEGFFSNDTWMQTAPTPLGPWSDAQKVIVGIPPPPGGRNYAGQEHYELSTNGGRTVAVTYTHTTGGLTGQMRFVNVRFN